VWCARACVGLNDEVGRKITSNAAHWGLRPPPGSNLKIRKKMSDWAVEGVVFGFVCEEDGGVKQERRKEKEGSESTGYGRA
jgi:hypothetical protein